MVTSSLGRAHRSVDAVVDVLARVEIDVFSGVSNPCQSVSLELLLERFKCLSSIEEPAPQASTLGYRGIIICFPLEFGGRTRVFRGYVSNATGCWLDNDRLFETWILEIVSDALGDASLKAALDKPLTHHLDD